MSLRFSRMAWSSMPSRRRRWRCVSFKEMVSISKGKSITPLKFIQINLKHSKVASANLLVYIIENNIKVCLIQEPWVSGGKIMGLNHKDFNVLYKVSTDNTRPRCCILVHKHFNHFLLSNFSDADTTTARLELSSGPITVVSSYLDMMETHQRTF
ncbi:hypothetical protein BGY98DRAFT_78073 [Russula aff. rugulosa BPL654]|nr:hypothetical protein BGY98DRAFT_78073 [Russula aff. rugulosa BPL654]